VLLGPNWQKVKTGRTVPSQREYDKTAARGADLPERLALDPQLLVSSKSRTPLLDLRPVLDDPIQSSIVDGR
jgi:hypothetical protein